jgi:hypothetical protein
MWKRISLGLFILLLSLAIIGCEFRITRAPLFKDNFDDNDLSIPPPGWGDAGGIYVRKTSVGTFPNEYYLDIWGPLEGYAQQARNGLYHFLVGDEVDGGIRPNSISFDIIPDFSGNPDHMGYLGGHIGYFDLMGHVSGDPFLKAGISIHFLNRFQEQDTMISVRTGSGIEMYGPYGPMGLYHIEMSNIDWSVGPRPRYDLIVNGDLLGSCLDFIQPVASLTQVDVYNIDSGRAMYDNIRMEVDEVIPCLPEPPQPPALPPVTVEPTITPTLITILTAPPTPTATPTPTTSPDIIVTALENLNCRAGTTAQFDVLHILMQGETAKVLGVNASLTWAYLEIPDRDLRCWAWRGGLEDTQGDPDRAPVTREPNTPTPTSTATPIVCTPDLPENLCVESGGTWSGGAAEAPVCTCP